MYEKHVLGKKGEKIATNFLKKLGYKIIETNFSCRQGEIDIIAKDNSELVFVEVKTRKSLEYGSPADAVNTIKKIHIYKVAEYYLYLKKI